MTDREAMKLALEALENGKRVRAYEGGTKYQPDLEDATIATLRQALAQPEQETDYGEGFEEGYKAALAQPEQEPVAWMEDSIEFYAKDHPTNSCTIPLYTAPPSKPWQSLTEEERCTFVSWFDYKTVNEIFNAIEAALRSKNT